MIALAGGGSVLVLVVELAVEHGGVEWHRGRGAGGRGSVVERATHEGWFDCEKQKRTAAEHGLC